MCPLEMTSARSAYLMRDLAELCCATRAGAYNAVVDEALVATE